MYDGGGFAKGGVGTSSVDGKIVDSHRVDTTCLSPCHGLKVSTSVRTIRPPWTPIYQVPFKFTGNVAQVVFHTGPLKISQSHLSDADLARQLPNVSL